jgi:TonB family protein
MSTLIYFLQANLFLILFFGFYYFLFKKETFHAVNRFFLLFGAVFAMVLPFIKSPFLKELPVYPVEAEHVITDYYFVTAAIVETPLTHQITYLEVFEYIYWVGLGLSILFLLFRISKTILWVKNHKYYSGIAFSFFGKVFIDSRLSGKDCVEKHEEIHVRQLHFVDLLFFEILKTVFWFNPVVYSYKKAIEIIHEFSADEVASAIAKDKAQYAQILLSKQFRAESTAIFTQHFFNHSTLKSRIIMLSKNPSKKTALLKYGIVAPLFFVMLLVSSFTLVKPANLEIVLTKMEDVIIDDINTNFQVESLPLKSQKDTLKPQNSGADFTLDSSEIQPEFPGGTVEMYKFLSETVKYPLPAQEAQVEGKVFVRFKVEVDGTLKEVEIVKGIGFGCDVEAKRVIALMPKWNPAIVEGKPISVFYNLPIVFKLKDRVGFIDSSIPEDEMFYFPVEPDFLKKTPKGYFLFGDEGLLNRKIIYEDNNVKFNFDVSKYYKGPISFKLDENKPHNISLNKNFYSDLNKNKQNQLVLVDNKEISFEELRGINPNTINNLRVLKNKDLIVIYGEKAKNGVILIETKKE